MQNAAEAELAPSDPPLIGGLIRARRLKAGLTLQAIAGGADISAGYLSLIERDKAVPTLTTLDRIARALGAGLDEFVTRPGPVDCVTRAATRPRFYLGNELLGYERVSAQFPGVEMSSYVLTAAPGYHSERVIHAGEEHVFVLEGALELRLDGDKLTLNQGDSVHYASDRSHGWANPFKTTARVLWTGTHDIFTEKSPG